MVPLNRTLLWAACAVFLLGTSNDILAQAAGASDANTQSQQSTPAPQESSSGNSSLGTSNAETSSPPASQLPDSPGTTAQAAGSGQPQESEVTPQEQKLQRPVGTAAAEAPKVNGVTAARPAGVAIAPAKQHRVRTIVIRTGAILGAGAALGVVIALASATPSKPPGAR